MEKKKKITKKKKKPARKPKAPAAAPVETSPMPTAGRVITDFENTLDQYLNEVKPKRGGKRPGAGRPPKNPEPETAMIQPEQMRDAVTQLLNIPFDAWAAQANIEALALKKAEAEMLTDPTIVLLDYYAPRLTPITMAWASLGVVALAIMRPRILLLKQLNKKQPATQQPATQQPARKQQQPAGPNQKFPTDQDVKTVVVDG